MKKAVVLGVAALVVAVAAGTLVQERKEVERTGKIPRGYKTYSLFLVCNPQWLEHRQGNENFDQLNDLYQQFNNFGRTIGDDNLAVWFWVYAPSFERKAGTKNVDVERSVRLCKAWHLTPSAGPHIVVTSTYPDEFDLVSGLPKDSAVFELGNMESAQISKLLAKLTDELLEKGHVDTASKAPEAGWVRLLGAVQQTISKFGCAWSFKIDAGPVKADLHSCKS